MSEEMKFPDALDEFIKQYSFIDEEQIYTNGSELIQTFRIKQWEEHKKQENQELKNSINALQKELNEENFQCSKYAIENQELKKQLKNYKKLGFKHLQDKNNNLETQQKEFIEWLENENRKIYRDCGLRQNIFKQVLQKYEEIIGVSDENNKQ